LIQVQVWTGEQAPTEAVLRSQMNAEGLQPRIWSNSPGDVYAPHMHGYHKVIYVLYGSITFELPDSGESATLNAGDRLDLPPGVMHSAVVGSKGVVCLEAHRR